MLYQRRDLTTGTDVGDPSLLPVTLRGLSDATLADLGAIGSPGVGYTPVSPEPPPPLRWIHKAIFKRRFTFEERIAIRATEESAETPLEVRMALSDFREILDATDQVFLDDPAVIDGLAFLVTLGILGELRPAQIRE